MNQDIKQQLQVAFEIYDRHNALLDTIDGPGDIGSWLPDPDAPMEVAIIPAPYGEGVKRVKPDEILKVYRIPIDENDNNKEPEKEAIFLYMPPSKDKALALARELGCDFMYWSEWDGVRTLYMVELKSDVHFVYCFPED